jgi:hypothetical protein
MRIAKIALRLTAVGMIAMGLAFILISGIVIGSQTMGGQTVGGDVTTREIINRQYSEDRRTQRTAYDDARDVVAEEFATWSNVNGALTAGDANQTITTANTGSALPTFTVPGSTPNVTATMPTGTTNPTSLTIGTEQTVTATQATNRAAARTAVEAARTEALEAITEWNRVQRFELSQDNREALAEFQVARRDSLFGAFVERRTTTGSFTTSQQRLTPMGSMMVAGLSLLFIGALLSTSLRMANKQAKRDGVEA